MDETQLKRLEAMGGRGTTVAEFLQLSPEEEAHIEIKLALRRLEIELRQRRGLSQAQLAEILHTKQPGVARMENDARGTGFDMLIKALIELGATPTEIGSAISGVVIHGTGRPSRWAELAATATATADDSNIVQDKPAKSLRRKAARPRAARSVVAAGRSL